MTVATDIQQSVQNYYGRVLATQNDLKTSACCSTDALPADQRAVLKLIDDEIIEKFYGCGSPIPPAIEGCTVLDLGCGTGRDVYLASHRVGPTGFVIGVDMTDPQLAVARRHIDAQTRRFGYAQPNVDFRLGFIEDLRRIGIADDSVDVVISNCVINLSPEKEPVFSEIFRVLKPGGELYFADVFAGRRVPESLQADPVLRGECLGGALYGEDFRRLLTRQGCPDYRVVAQRPITLDHPEIAAKVGMVDFYSMTIRAFKLPSLEDRCEDYGQTATYLGTISGHPHRFALDDHHTFITGKPMLVCGNTAAMVSETRFGRHFQIGGNRQVHYGLFDCSPAAAKTGGDSGGACC